MDKAISCYKKAVEINPKYIGAHNNLGLIFRELNDFKNAINCYEKVIAMKPDHVGAHHNLALAYKELGEFEKAIKSHQIAIKYEPDKGWRFYRTNLSHRQKKYFFIIEGIISMRWFLITRNGGGDWNLNHSTKFDAKLWNN